jgi:hypothetical protein
MERNELEVLFLEFSKKLKEIMLDCFPDGNLPTLVSKRIKFTHDGWNEEEQESISLWSGFNGLDPVEICKLKQTQACVKALIDAGIMDKPKMSDNSGKLIPNPSYNQYAPHVAIEMCYPFFSVITRNEKIRATDLQLIKAYKKYCKHWQNTENNFLMRVPLHNFECDFDNYKFDRTMSIETMSYENKSKIFGLTKRGFFDEAPSGFDIHGCSHLLSWLFKSPKGIGTFKWEGSIGHMLTAFRLYKAGDIGSKFHVTEHLDPVTSFSGLRGSPLVGFWIPAHGKKYQIDGVELPKAFKIFKDLCKLEKCNKLLGLNVALRRFNQSYSRKLPEDKIIDLTIALESILLSAEKDELQYKLATRGARLLKKKSDPLKTRSVLKLLYTLRSAIVHEGLVLSSPSKSIKKNIRSYDADLKPSEIPCICEDIVRAVILEYMSRLRAGNSVQEINLLIDDEMISV